MTTSADAAAALTEAIRHFWRRLTYPWRRRLERLEDWARWDPDWGAHMVGFVRWQTLDTRSEPGQVVGRIADACSVPLGVVGVVITDRGTMWMPWRPPLRFPVFTAQRGGLRYIMPPGCD